MRTVRQGRLSMEEGEVTTPQMPFKQPAKNSGFFSPRDHQEWLGRLFLIYPDRVVTKTFNAEEGPVDMVEADVAIIDLIDPQTGQPTVLQGTTIGGKALVPQLKTQLGAMVLGRLAQGQAQGSKSGAYFLTDFTDQDGAAAQQYIQTHPRQQFAQPQAQTPAANVAQGQQYVQQQYGQAPAPAPYGAPQGAPNGQPQYASQQLPYDPWQGTQAAPQGQPQAAPAGPPQGQWGAPPQGQPQQWAPPAANGQAPAAAPAAAPQPSATGEPQNPQLVQFLQSKGVPVTPDMSNAQMQMIAATYGQPQ